MKLEYITLSVADPSILETWYTQHLGLRVGYKSERSVQLIGDGGAKLLFHVGSPITEPSRINLHFEVEDVDREYERLCSRGVVFDRPPEDKPWGMRTCYTKDPAGHTVELVTPIKRA